MQNKNKCPKCGRPYTKYSNSDEYYCDKCGFDEHYNNSKNEVLSIIEDAFKYIKWKCNEDGVCAPNGEYWDYDDVMKFLKENLK